MKATFLRVAVCASIFFPLTGPAYMVYMPPGNIVQNPTFSDLWNHWSGTIQGAATAWPEMPNDNALLLTDAYQDLPTVAGKQYALDFYMAADLFFGPSVTVNVNVGGLTLETVVTPPYALNGGNRYGDAHWQEVSGLFTATGSSARLEFVDVNTHDFLLASVSVIPIPEPTTFSLLIGGLGALVIAGRLRRR